MSDWKYEIAEGAGCLLTLAGVALLILALGYVGCIGGPR